jgi:outer membrane autotransporter protein
MALEPFAGIAFVKVDTDSFKEHGEVAALRSGGFDEDVSYSTLGLRAATTMHVSNLIVTPKVAAAWQHAFDDVTPGAALAFASTGIGFDITGVPLAENSLLVEAGLDSI